MVDFRIAKQRFFFDERVRDMPQTDYRYVFLYLILGSQACSQTETGIYEIGRGEISFGTKIEIDIVENIINYFNKYKKELVEYDLENHVVFVKSFLKHNSDYLNTPEKIAAAIKKDFKKTGEKCPQFWGEFAILNKKMLEKACGDLSSSHKSYNSYKKMFNNLFFLGDELKKTSLEDKTAKNSKIFLEAPKNLVQRVCVEKMQKDIEKLR